MACAGKSILFRAERWLKEGPVPLFLCFHFNVAFGGKVFPGATFRRPWKKYPEWPWIMIWWKITARDWTKRNRNRSRLVQVKLPFRLREKKQERKKEALNEGKQHRSWRRRHRGRRRRGLNLCAQLDESFFFVLLLLLLTGWVSAGWLTTGWLVLAQQIIPYCRNGSGVREGRV